MLAEAQFAKFRQFHGDSPHWVFILCHRRFFLCTRFLFIYADKDRLYIKAGLCLGQVNPGNTVQFLALSLSLHNVFQGRNEQEHAVGEMQLLNCTVLEEMMFVSFKKKKKVFVMAATQKIFIYKNVFIYIWQCLLPFWQCEASQCHCTSQVCINIHLMSVDRVDRDITA